MGDEESVNYTSVTQSTFVPGVLSRLSPVVIDRLEKKRSTVLDNPDGEVSDMKSVNQIGESPSYFVMVL